MPEQLHFETPENIALQYRPAGLGTRFIAWLADSILCTVVFFVACILLLIVSIAADETIRKVLKEVEEQMGNNAEFEAPRVVYIVIGLMTIAWSFGSMLYMGVSEYLGHGMTLGKRMCKIRVVSADGFALDAKGIFIRNLLRMIDHIPALWIVPVLSARSQRIGDMLAGTFVVSNERETVSVVRDELSSRSSTDAEFRFDHAKLGRLSTTDFDAVERILDRWTALTLPQQEQFLDRIVTPLCRKMGAEEPPLEKRAVFLEDLMSAEYRRQDRHLH